ncbi:MAG: phosphate-starvation-inducible PsiE family protein [Lyngbya sp. HA4199-MV5]|nr:phosphate-starvation-inducible PsiE family protein [Lyngbya sp. HA4199-MV5]
MRSWHRVTRLFQQTFSDDSFLRSLRGFEGLVSKVLSIAMVFVIVLSVWELVTFLVTDAFRPPYGQFGTTLFAIFGLFLNVLIALEILENITAYLKNHVIQVELVIVTSLVAVSRKIIILDLEKTAGLDLIALAAAILALSISYWLVRHVNRHAKPHDSDET